MSKRTYKKTIASSTISLLLLSMLLSSLLLFSSYIVPTVAGTVTPWPMYLHDSNHTGYTTDDGPTTARLTWSYETDGPIFGSPVVADGVVYIGSTDGMLYAINDITGMLIWNTTVGSVSASTPVIVGDVVYVGANTNWTITSGPAYDGKTAPPYNLTAGIIVALDKNTGAKLWNYTIVPPGGVNPFRSNSTIIWSSPIIVGNMLYIGSCDNNTYAIDVTTHNKIWNYTTEGWVQSVPAVLGGAVYFSTMVTYNVTHATLGPASYIHDSYVYALDASTGNLIWKWQPNGSKLQETDPENPIYGMWQRATWSPAVAETPSGTMVYVSALEGVPPLVGHGFYALNASAACPDEKRIVWVGPGGYCITFFGSPIVHDGVVYQQYAFSLGGGMGGLHAWNAATGAELTGWPIYPIRSDILSITCPVIAGNNILYIPSGLAESVGLIYAVNLATRATLAGWPFQCSQGVYGPPAIYNGAIYVGSVDGIVYKIGPPPPNPNLAIGPGDIVLNTTAAKVGDMVSINVTVRNVGAVSTGSVTIRVRTYYDEILIEEKKFTGQVLDPEAYKTYTSTWNTSNIFEGAHTISAEVVPIAAETITTDNTMVDGVVAVYIPITANITHDWPTFLHDSNHTGYTEAIGPTIPRINWISDINAVHGGSVSLAVVGGTVYAVAQNFTYALDADTGVPIWNYTIAFLNGVGETAPTVVGDVVFVGSGSGLPQPVAVSYPSWMVPYAHWSTEKVKNGGWSILLNTGVYNETAESCCGGSVVIIADVFGDPIDFSGIADSDLTYWGYFNGSAISTEPAYYPYFTLTIEYLNGTQTNTTTITSVGSWTVGGGNPTNNTWIQMRAQGGWYGNLFPSSNITHPKTMADVGGLLNATNKANVTSVILSYGSWNDTSLLGGTGGFKAEDWTVYIDDITVEGRNIPIEPTEKMYALNTDGTLLWKNLKVGHGVSDTPQVVDGVVYVNTGGNGLNGTVYALNNNTGATIWSFTMQGASWGSPVVFDDVVYVTTTIVNWTAFGGDIWGALNKPWLIGGWLYALDADDGSLLWNFTITGGTWFGWKGVLASPAVADTAVGRIVYLGALDTNGLYALNASKNGALIYTLGSDYITFGGSPIVRDGVVYKGCGDLVRAFNATTGVAIWNASAEGGTGDNSPAIDKNGILYTGNENGILLALNTTDNGKKIWSFTVAYGSVNNLYSPAVVDDLVYLVSEEGKVYSIGGRIPPLEITKAQVILPYGAEAIFSGWTFSVNATVENTGIQGETVQVTAWYGYGTEPMSGSAQLLTIPAGTDRNTTMTWKSTGAEPSNCTYPADPKKAGKYTPYNVTVEATLTAEYNPYPYGNLTIRMPADANGDGHCSVGDLALLGGAWNQAYPSPYYKWKADFNGDGKVYTGDLAILGMNYMRY